MDQRPIGVFDSGLGGLTIVQAIRRLLPAESIIFAADSARAPYGSRSPVEVTALASALTSFLVAEGAKLVVVACNTATVHALAHLRAAYPATPFVGVVPVVKTLARRTRTGAIAVLSTPATAESAYLRDLIASYAPCQRVVNIAGAGLVELIEAGAGRELIAERLRDCLAPLSRADVDVLGLGCTHFPLIRPLVKQVVGPGVRVFDPARPVARQTARLLTAADALAAGEQGACRIYTSGEPERFVQTASRFALAVMRGACVLPLRLSGLAPVAGSPPLAGSAMLH